MSDIGSILELHPGVFQRGLNSLEKQEFVTSSYVGRKRLFRMNREHPLQPHLGEHLEAFDKGLPYDLLTAPSRVIQEPSPVYDAAALKVLIIAGPNGAGKSTFARHFLGGMSHCDQFVNADSIAAALSPFNPDAAAARAARLMIKEVASHVSARRNFAIETTLSGRRYQREIQNWKSNGYRVKIIFLSLPSVDLAIERVAIRVAQGGHSIPEPIIRRRFERGLQCFYDRYQSMADAWALYDSSGAAPVLVKEGEE